MVIKLSAVLESTITQKLYSPHTFHSKLSGWAYGEEVCYVTPMKTGKTISLGISFSDCWWQILLIPLMGSNIRIQVEFVGVSLTRILEKKRVGDILYTRAIL